jgi:hypothetical protein
LQITIVLSILSSILFFTYGVGCFFSAKLKIEFERYGFKKYRVTIAILEILGSIGLLVGLYYQPIFILSSGGLSMLMFCAIIVRGKIKDPLSKWIPAIFLFFINLILFIESLNYI